MAVPQAVIEERKEREKNKNKRHTQREREGESGGRGEEVRGEEGRRDIKLGREHPVRDSFE